MAVNPDATPEASPSAEAEIVHPEEQQKAIDTYQYILDTISPDNEEVRKTLAEWKKSLWE